MASLAAALPDKTLHGNGEDCPACALRRDELRASAAIDQVVSCNFCGGSGRVGRAVADIIREAVQWARVNYWPEREASWRISQEGGRDTRPTPGRDKP